MTVPKISLCKSNYSLFTLVNTAPLCQELTMEEYNFLEEYGLADDDGSMESQTWSTGDANGMGEEMEAAFEEFLRTQS